MSIVRPTLDDYIVHAAEKDISDLHFVPDQPVYYRDTTTGKLRILDGSQGMSSEDIRGLLFQNATIKRKIAHFNAGDIDISLTTDTANGAVHSRLNLFFTHKGIAVAIRIFPSFIPSMNKLGLPGVVQNLIRKPYGLIVFTAPTGNGKTTSIASMLETINDNEAKRIITIEDPVEYVFTSKQSVISQREVGTSCKTFAEGLRAALREDPDIIMVGEMRDKETILTAISAAESGHLVFSTLHAGDTVQAIDRIKQYFSGSEQEQIQAQFANAFQAVVAQKLIPRKDKQGRVAAFEVLLNNDATRNLVRIGEAFRLPGYMNLKDGMFTMKYSINDLQMRGVIENGQA